MRITVRRIISARNGGVIFSGVTSDGRLQRFVIRTVPRTPRPGEIWFVEGEARVNPAFGEQIHAEAASPDGEPLRSPGSEAGFLQPDTIQEARLASPEFVLRMRFGDVRVSRCGSSLTVEDVLRVDRLDDGHWVACDWAGGGIGDNIALARHLLGIGFREAVALLNGKLAGAAPAPRVQQPQRTQFELPPYDSWIEGQAYLATRGISDAAIRLAEASGALSYTYGAVVFVGLDHSREPPVARSATIRSYMDSSRHPKRDVTGSDKLYPMLLRGADHIVVVVEGGVSGLAAWDLLRMVGNPAPTVIATGGVSVYRWVTANRVLSALLARAAQVEIWGENESDPQKQVLTDVHRRRLQAAIESLRPKGSTCLRRPPLGMKDAADCLQCIRSGQPVLPWPVAPVPAEDNC